MVPLTSGSESLRSSCFSAPVRRRSPSSPVRFWKARPLCRTRSRYTDGCGSVSPRQPTILSAHRNVPRRGRRASRSAAQCNPVIPAVPICACQRRIHHRLRRRACPSLPGRRSDCARPRRADAKFDLRFSLLDRPGDLHNQLLRIVPTPVRF